MQKYSNTPTLIAAITYNGSMFYGSQFQKHHATVAGTLKQVFESFGITTKINFAGRTDKGVHALQNIIALKMPYTPSNLEYFKEQMNKKLFPHIQIISLKIAHYRFHPRFDAKARQYRYIISTQTPNVFYAQYVSFSPIYNAHIIKNAINIFKGTHDFYFFSKKSHKNSIRTITQARFYRHKKYYIFSFTGNGFLRSQIRFMVGALLELDKGKLTTQQLFEQLQTYKQHTTQLAPPQGLYLCRIYY